MTYIPLKNYRLEECPFGIRDLNKDECYSGNNVNKCKYFVKYNWTDHYGCVECTCKLTQINQHEKHSMQLELFS